MEAAVDSALEEVEVEFSPLHGSSGLESSHRFSGAGRGLTFSFCAHEASEDTGTGEEEVWVGWAWSEETRPPETPRAYDAAFHGFVSAAGWENVCAAPSLPPSRVL
jgi:hypothetical protein